MPSCRQAHLSLKVVSMRPVVFVVSLILICLLISGCAADRDFDDCLRSIVEPYRFSLAKWEFKTLPDEVKQSLFGKPEKVDDEISVVADYFALNEQIRKLEADREQGDASSETLKKLREQRAALAVEVERILEKQIREALAGQGIFNPADWSEVRFPPLSFRLETPPHLLVVSPRDRIESIREIPLQPAVSLEEAEAIEAEVDKLGVSSLMVELGGFGGTFPTLVSDDASLRFTLDTIVEEWLHQYLSFKPLGFRYVLDTIGVSRNYEIATMNETVASMVSQEIGALVLGKYYSQQENGMKQSQTAKSGFDFNKEMREIRKAVDEYLARGETEAAEAFMEQKRQYLASMGYRIRKLNQAYFAYYGTYADEPTSISPVGVELKKLREQSASLKDFLDKVAIMTSRQDLKVALEEGS